MHTTSLIPNLPALDCIINDPASIDSTPSVSNQLEELSFHLKNTFWALYYLEGLLEDIADQYSSRLRPGGQVMIEDELKDKLDAFITAYFTAARRSQNAITRQLSFCPERRSLPRSINKLVNRLNSGALTLEPTIQVMILQYWEESGSRLKEYRDLCEHACIITSEPVVFLGQHGSVEIKHQLPRNPEEDSPSRLDFQNGPQVIEYLHESFLELIVFINQIVEELINLARPGMSYAEARGPRVHSTIFRSPIVMGVPLIGSSIPIPDSIASTISARLRQMRGE